MLSTSDLLQPDRGLPAPSAGRRGGTFILGAPLPAQDQDADVPVITTLFRPAGAEEAVLRRRARSTLFSVPSSTSSSSSCAEGPQPRLPLPGRARRGLPRLRLHPGHRLLLSRAAGRVLRGPGGGVPGQPNKKGPLFLFFAGKKGYCGGGASEP